MSAGINNVLTIMGKPKYPPVIVNNKFIEAHDNEFESLTDYFVEAHNFISLHRKSKVLVHCAAGVSRYSTVSGLPSDWRNENI